MLTALKGHGSTSLKGVVNFVVIVEPSLCLGEQALFSGGVW